MFVHSNLWISFTFRDHFPAPRTQDDGAGGDGDGEGEGQVGYHLGGGSRLPSLFENSNLSKLLLNFV